MELGGEVAVITGSSRGMVKQLLYPGYSIRELQGSENQDRDLC